MNTYPTAWSSGMIPATSDLSDYFVGSGGCEFDSRRGNF